MLPSREEQNTSLLLPLPLQQPIPRLHPIKVPITQARIKILRLRLRVIITSRVHQDTLKPPRLARVGRRVEARLRAKRRTVRETDLARERERDARGEEGEGGGAVVAVLALLPQLLVLAVGGAVWFARSGFLKLLLQQDHPAGGNARRTAIARRDAGQLLSIEVPERQPVFGEVVDEPIRHAAGGAQVGFVAGERVEFGETVDAPRLAAGPGAVVREALGGAAGIDIAGAGAVVAHVEGGAVGADVVEHGFVGVRDGDGQEGGVVRVR